MQGEEKEAHKVLLNAKRAVVANADIHHALGLFLVRQKKANEAVVELETAARLAPENYRYIYVYAVALNATGKTGQAIEQLQLAHNRFPNNVEILQALISINRDAGNAFAAERYMKKLKSLNQVSH